jgi:heme exporter protein D
MQWANASEFFAMGGYGLYVWGSFGACALLMAMEPFLASKRLREARQVIARELLAEKLDKETQ